MVTHNTINGDDCGKKGIDRRVMRDSPRIAVVVPSYKVRDHILSVIDAIGPECLRIYVVDDACPEGTGKFVESNCNDSRVMVLQNTKNLGVGGAVVAGYRQALQDGAEIIVKIDGDGQMNPALISQFVKPIVMGVADYAKGNRFFEAEYVKAMPPLRIFGNAILSFMAKLSTGYWDIFDPNNGYTAIHAGVARQLPMGKICQGFFFETDMLFRLNALRAVVIDVPMVAKYGSEISNLKPLSELSGFVLRHLSNFVKRIAYNYYLRDMSLASLELPLGLLLLTFGTAFGAYHWFHSATTLIPASTGTVMLSALPLLIGLQFLLAFFAQDIATVPRRPIQMFHTIGTQASRKPDGTL